MRRMKRICGALASIILAFGGTTMAQGQEQLVPLGGNPMIYEAAKHLNHRTTFSGSRANDTLSLPFFDDFSEPFSRKNRPADLFPDSSKWIGRSVYINDHMAINPISVGVATFDGLNENGLAYGFGISIPSLSDSLTSKPINLAGAEGVYLSFHYQAQGNGLAPGLADVLLLEFKDTADTWEEVWSASGYELADSSFKRAMLPIADTAFLHSGFQFRFINYAAQAGSVDHWHIDYVTLDAGRTEADTIYKDVAFLYRTSSLLKTYQSMPWDHFKVNPELMMGDSNYFEMRNNQDSAQSVNYQFKILDVDGAELFVNDESSPVVDPSVVCGNRLNDCNNNSFDGFYFSLNTISDPTFYTLPTAPELSSDSSYFLVKNIFRATADDVLSNDTVVYQQKFYNYYAYDDGTAEVAYGLGNLQFPGQVAIKYDVVKPDKLRAIQYYLNPVAEDLSNDPIRFLVWTGTDIPDGQPIYVSDEVYMSYSTGMNYMNHFFLDSAINIEGTVFIGWQQQPVAGQKFSIGFDRSYNASEKVFYSIGSAPWSQSSIPGSVMFRPVFGNPYNWAVGAEELEPTATLIAYPNPTSGTIFISESRVGQFASAKITLYDVTGRDVLFQNGYTNTGIDASTLGNGLYILEVIDAKGKRFTQRIIIQS